MPVAVALGGDPALTYSATAPLPDNIDEFLLAGFLRKQKVELVKCYSQDIEVPAEADIIIEGYIDPEEEFICEGPVGDHTGFYSLADWYPKFHVTCITHRKDAIYPATIVGVPPMEDAWIGKATERIFLSPIKLAVLPEIIDYDMPFEGVAHNIVIVKINKTYPGQAFKVMNALWGAGQMMFNKILIVVDNDIDTHDYKSIANNVFKNVEPENDILFINGPLDVLDHSASKPTYGGKMGIDATIKFDEEIENNINAHIKEISTDLSNIRKKFEEIIELNYGIHKQILIISVKKKSKEQINDFINIISDQKELATVKFCVLIDEKVDVNDVNMITWIASGNIDPKRDSVIVKGNRESCSKIFIDATRKSAKKDNFKRDWPNIVVSDDKTIKSVDNLWKHIGLGDFIESPSLKYRKLNKGDGAIAE